MNNNNLYCDGIDFVSVTNPLYNKCNQIPNPNFWLLYLKAVIYCVKDYAECPFCIIYRYLYYDNFDFISVIIIFIPSDIAYCCVPLS